MENAKDRFEKLWRDFTDAYKGSLIAIAQKQAVTPAVARMVLDEARLKWNAEHNLYSAWLNELLRDDTEKGNLVKEILTKDMTISETTATPAASSSSQPARLIVPVAAGAAGYAVARLVGCGMLATAASALIPAILAVPLTNSVLHQREQQSAADAINAYIAQLDKYRQSVISTLIGY